MKCPSCGTGLPEQSQFCDQCGKTLDGPAFHRRPVKSPGFVLGRSEDCDLVYPNDNVSSRHARVTLESNGRLRITDLGSANGTFINGKRVQNGLVVPADKVRLGKTELNVPELFQFVRELALRTARGDDIGGQPTPTDSPLSWLRKLWPYVAAITALMSVALGTGLFLMLHSSENSASLGILRITLSKEGGQEWLRNEEGEIVAAIAYEEGAFPEPLSVQFQVQSEPADNGLIALRIEADQHIVAAPGKRIALALRVPNSLSGKRRSGSLIPIHALGDGDTDALARATMQDGEEVAGQILRGEQAGSHYVLFGVDHFSGYAVLRKVLDETGESLSGALSNGDRVASRKLVQDKDGNTIPLWLPSGFMQKRVLTAWSGSLRSVSKRREVYKELLREVFLQPDGAVPTNTLEAYAGAAAETLDWIGAGTMNVEAFLRSVQVGASQLKWVRSTGAALRLPAGRMLRDFFVGTKTFAGAHSTYHASFSHLANLCDNVAGKVQGAGNIVSALAAAAGIVLLADETMKYWTLPTVLQRALVEQRMALFEQVLADYPGTVDPALQAAFLESRGAVTNYLTDQTDRFTKSLVWAWQETGSTELTIKLLTPKLVSLSVALLPKGVITAVAAKLGIGAAAAGSLIGLAVVAVVYTALDIIDFEKTLVASSLAATLSLEYLRTVRKQWEGKKDPALLGSLGGEELYADYLYFDLMHHGLKEFNVEAKARWAFSSLANLYGEGKCKLFDCQNESPTFLAYQDWLNEEYDLFNARFKAIAQDVASPRATVNGTAVFDRKTCTLEVAGTAGVADTTGPVSVYAHPNFNGSSLPSELQLIQQGQPGPFSSRLAVKPCTKPAAVLLQARPSAGVHGVKLLPVSCTGNQCEPEPYSDPDDHQTQQVAATIQQVDLTTEPGKVRAYAVVTTQLGTPLERLTAGNFKVVEKVAGYEYPVTIDKVTTAEQQPDPLNVCLVVDSSSSMKGSAIRATRIAAQRFIEKLQPQDSAAIVRFASGVRTVVSFTDDKSLLSKKVSRLHAEGMTALWDGVIHGLKLTDSRTGQKAVIVLSDGGDNRSRHSLNKAAAMARSMGIPVFTLGLGVEPKTARALRQLADKSNAGKKGQGYYEAPSESDLSRLYDSISTKLKKTYVVSWPSNGTPGDAIEATVQISYQSAHGLLKETARTSYVLPQ